MLKIAREKSYFNFQDQIDLTNSTDKRIGKSNQILATNQRDKLIR